MKKISKLEFIKQIVDLLRSEVDEKDLRLILKDYTLYFNHELEIGKSEEDVLTFLYSPELFIETLRKSNIEETLKKLGKDDYNIFVELTKDYKNNSDSSSNANTDDTNKDNTSNSNNKEVINKDNTTKPSEDITSENITSENITSENIIDNTSNTNTINKKNIPNTKKGLGYIINFLLGLILLVIFIPIVVCGFVAGFIFIALSVLVSSTISLLYGFLSLISIIFIILSSLCLLMFGIGTICLNIQLTINYVKYFFLVNSINLEDKQNA